jgi:carboxyl-terminal processing protease
MWIERTDHASAVWQGPLGVLIDRGSASASEIFAAAIQDCGRGFILGETSFGKGTVQTVVNLDQFARTGKPQLGELKMTVAQFFRVNGGTTQLRGITPDIVLPGLFEDAEFGELGFDNAIAWTQIKKADYVPGKNVQAVLPSLMAKHEARINEDRDYKFLQEDIAEFKHQRQRNEISLNENERRKERDAREARVASRKSQKVKNTSEQSVLATQESVPMMDTDDPDDGLESDERDLALELSHEKSRKSAKDIHLIEAAHILSDAVGILEVNQRLAANIKTSTKSRQKLIQ